MKRRGRSICSLLLLYLLANRSFAEELTLNVNFRQPIAVTDEKFLSLTLDPAALFHGSALRYVYWIYNVPILPSRVIRAGFMRKGKVWSQYFARGTCSPSARLNSRRVKRATVKIRGACLKKGSPGSSLWYAMTQVSTFRSRPAIRDRF